MKLELTINHPNDYALDIGAPVFHPHVSLIHYDEVGPIRHSLNLFNVYALFLQKEFPENVTYGIGTYTEGNGSLMAYSPGQIGGKADNGTRRQYHGWVLLFDASFIRGSEIEQRLADYHFFSYNANEALILTTGEKDILTGLMANIRNELAADSDDGHRDQIVRDYIQLILDYCNRFYTRQFKEQRAVGNDILMRFQQLLTDYYSQGLQHRYGVPSVRYCAGELCLSAGYFGDLMRDAMHLSPKDFIRNFIIMRAKNLLLSGEGVSQTAYELGFEYANHFTRLFKNATGLTPSQFVNDQRSK